MAVVLAIIGTNDMYDLCEHVYFKWPHETKYTFIFLECESYKTCVMKHSKETKYAISQDTKIHTSCVDTFT